MAKKQKYYVVWVGATPGIYDNWQDCQLQIKGFPGAIYKSYKSKEEAIQAYSSQAQPFISSKTSSSKTTIKPPQNIHKDSIAVDAACSGNPGLMEYRGVLISDNSVLFHQGPFNDGTNNVGEFLALVHALALLHSQEQHDTQIYTDSKTAMAWVRNKKVKTTLKETSENKILFDLMERGIKWLKTHSFKNPIIKWDTKNWGEIPADFGRK